MWCGKGISEIAADLEPARLISVDPAELLGWESDPSEERVQGIMDAMRAGEEIAAIMTNASGQILYDGHHRREAARRLGVRLDAVAIPRSWSAQVGNNLGDLWAYAAATLGQ